MHGLRNLRVLDFSEGIAGPYASKLLADAGAEVVKVEPPAGDPMRTWSATGADIGTEDGALFRFLHTSKCSLVGAPEDPQILTLVEDADLVIEDFRPSRLDLPGLCARAPPRSSPCKPNAAPSATGGSRRCPPSWPRDALVSGWRVPLVPWPP